MLSARLRDAVLERFGFDAPLTAGVDGLTVLYTAWCRNVPFDNLRKLVALARGDGRPLPGLDPDDFFTAFLAHGTGGTCWPSSEAWLALLRACGFAAERAAATMHPDGIPEGSPDRPNHASTIVTVEDVRYVADTSMLSEQPLPLLGDTSATGDRVVGIDAERAGDRWVLRFMPWRPDGRLACEVDPAPIPERLAVDRYEYSRRSSPFNADVHARRNLAHRVVVAALGSAFRIERPSGASTAEPFDGDRSRRDAMLVEEMGYSEEIVAAVPASTVAP